MNGYKCRSLIYIFFLITLFLQSCSEVKENELLEIPVYQAGQEVLSYPGYKLLYNEEHEQASWVAYELKASEVNGNVERANNFRPDPNISTGSASLSDYKYSGYDRGHLIPAGDVTWSESAMSSTFMLSNISPQTAGFNRGDWRILESYVRNWAKKEGSVYVVTGPVLTQGIKERIGPNSVSVPRYYFKVVLDYTVPEQKGIGFIMPNTKIVDPIESYAVTIDSVEVFTGIDFYPHLLDKIEIRLESKVDVNLWDLNNFN